MLDSHQAEQEQANKPLYDRLVVVDELIERERGQLEQLLDLYLTGVFPKDVLIERKNRLESTVAALEKERVGLVAHLEAQRLTSDQIQTLHEFATHIAEGLEYADQDFDARRRIIDTLDVRITLTVEDGEKIVYAYCILDEEVLSVASTSTCFAPCER